MTKPHESLSNVGIPPAASANAVPADRAIFEHALPALRMRLLRHAKFALSDEGLAEDLVQDTLIVAMEKFRDRRGDASLTTWATAILKNRIADWYRSPAQRRTVELDRDDDELGRSLEAQYDVHGAYADAVPAWQQPDNSMEQRQMMTVLEKCVGCLPRQTGRIFMMREWLGFETAEICERANISAANCRTILHRARMVLRGCMQRDWVGEKAQA